ncbi:hypothetical protein AAY473_024050 [Plecturocebus cupreus]
MNTAPWTITAAKLPVTLTAEDFGSNNSIRKPSSYQCYQSHMSFEVVLLCHQAGVQWHDLGSPQSPPASSSNSPASASQVVGITGALHHTQLIFVFLVEMGFYHVGQDGLDLLTSRSAHLSLPKVFALAPRLECNGMIRAHSNHLPGLTDFPTSAPQVLGLQNTTVMAETMTDIVTKREQKIHNVPTSDILEPLTKYLLSDEMMIILLENLESGGRGATGLSQSTQSQRSPRRRAASGLGIVGSAAAPRRLTPGGPREPRAQKPLQPPGFALLLRLLPAQRHLGGHDALALGDQGALGTRAVAPAAEALVALERRHHAVVATAGALGRPRVAAAHRAHPPVQPRSRRAASASRGGGGGGGGPQKEAGRPQEGWGHLHRGRNRQGRGKGRRRGHHQPRSQLGSAATAAASAATL